ncbi:guanylate kinase [Candidatus Entotheonella palauensis]|nr:guanylate kinase [Candidatus Entotheonella palauensis]
MAQEHALVHTAPTAGGESDTERCRSQTRRGILFVISGPSGVGKTSLRDGIMAMVPNVKASISCTTRAPRPGEQDGREYFFISPETFDHYVATGAFLEWALVHEQRYGTLRSQVDEGTAAGYDMLLTIDVQGAENLRTAQIEARYIFILPPSWATLEARLQQRGSEDENVRMRRLMVARQELRQYTEYDYAITNDQLDTATEALRSIILAERQRIGRVVPALLDC